MPPPLSTPNDSTRTPSHHKTPSTSRRPSSRPLSVATSKNVTPRTTRQSISSAQLRNAKGNDVSEKENEPRATRERMASKDGTAQRNAKEVEGLKDYQLGDCVGRGAFGSVYRALNWSTGETVAVKQIRLQDLPKAELNVIMQEITLLKNLNHANIVKYHGYVKSADSLYIILEYCENGSLHSICKNFGKFPENLVAIYTVQMLQGLLFLHEQGVIHRDIKGANILTTKEGLVKLADFGVATKQQGLSEGSVVGTPYWMAPEVIELSGASTASDIWSLGCTVIELLDGKPPYHKFAPMPALFRIVNDDHPPLPEGVSPLVRDFLMQCFQKDPNMRVTAKKLLRHPWILSAKKAEKKSPPEHGEAIKYVQEWNEALKTSPKASLRARSPAIRHNLLRPSSRGQLKTSSGRPSNLRTTALQAEPQVTNTVATSVRTRAQTRRMFTAVAEDPKKDNWDDDFEALAGSVAALRIPERLRPQDHFAGQMSSEKLKQYANHDQNLQTVNKIETWDEEFVGDLTVRSPLERGTAKSATLAGTIQTSNQSHRDSRSHRPPSSLAHRTSQAENPSVIAAREAEPRTQVLRSSRRSTISKIRPVAPQLVRTKTAPAFTAAKELFREKEADDFSDLVLDDHRAFEAKVAGFTPTSKTSTGQIHGITASQLVGPPRHRTHTPSNLVHDAAAIRRSRSSLEIQKYSEVGEDDDFTDLGIDDEGDGPMELRSRKDRSSPQSSSLGSETASSDQGTLRLPAIPLWSAEAEDEDDDDPFAALEEELDQVDLESNVARDKHARLCTLVESLVTELKVNQSEDVLGEIVEQLLDNLSQSPDVKTVIVSSHGMLPILEILDTCTRPTTILRLLRIVNFIIGADTEVQENLCFVGGIPIISKFAHKKYSSDIRLEAAAFVRMMYQTSTLTLQMFVSCGGLNVLVEFLEEEYESDIGRDLVLTGVNGVWSVFELQGPTPKNDFCRIFSRSSVLYPLSLVLNRVLAEGTEQGEIIEGRIVNIFLLFSQAENHVKEMVADRMVLKYVLKDLGRMSPQHQITMLKFIKNLSMLATTLDALQNSNAIEVLTDLLGASMHASHFREISNQILNTMYNLCRLSKARQEDAALSGVIPLLQRIVKAERPLKEFALPILCDMAHSGKVGRKVLWQNKGLQFYVSLLADQYWAVTALDAIFIWLQEETAKVEEHLLHSTRFSESVVKCFNESKADAFESLLEPLQKLLRLSPPIAATLAQRTLFERSGVKLHAKKPLVRLNLLRVIRSICDATEDRATLLHKHGLLDMVQSLARQDTAILVREMALEILKGNESTPPTPGSARFPPILRRTSSSRNVDYFG